MTFSLKKDISTQKRHKLVHKKSPEYKEWSDFDDMWWKKSF